MLKSKRHKLNLFAILACTLLFAVYSQSAAAQTCPRLVAPGKLERVWIKTTTTVKKLFGVYRYTCILINLPSNVDKLKLDTNIVSAVSTGSSASQVSVEVSASDPENDVLTFNYFVSAGAIKGIGSKVIWDLSGAQPGSYTIRVGVDDGLGICGRTLSQSVTVFNP